MDTKQKEQWQQGSKLLKKGQFHEAAALLDRLNNQVDDFRVNLALTFAEYQDQQYLRARQIAEERAADYLKTLKDAELLINVEIADQQFMTARRQIAMVRQWQEQLLPLVEAGEQKAEATMMTSVKTRWREFYHLGDKSFREQQQRLLAASRLPLPYYLKGALFLLRDPFTNPLIRSSILETLQPLKIERQAKVYWLDEQEHELNLAQLQPIDSLPVAQQLRQMVETRYRDKDPVSYQTISRELNLQFIYLYPFLGLAIDEPKSWLSALTSSGNMVQRDEGVEKALRWQQRINRLVTRISH